MKESLKRALLDGRFEDTEIGLLVPSERTIVSGVFCYGKRGEPLEFTRNMLTTEGRNYLLTAGLRGGTVHTSWFVAPFSGDVTVQATWTAANFNASATEVQAYVAATRPAWAGGSVSAGAVDSFAAKAEFKATTDGVVIRGAAMLSASAKASTSGTLLAAARFTSTKTLDTDEILDIGYGIQLVAAT
jgi:hypothetical protein